MDEKLIELRESALSYLDRFEAELPKLVSELRSGNTSGMSTAADAAEGARWLMVAVAEVTGDAEVDAERLADGLKAMEDAVGNRDCVLLADVIEYELLDLASEWRGKLK